MPTIAEYLDAGKKHQQAGHFHLAEPFYRQVLHLDPSSAHTWYLLGVVCHAQGKHTEAAESFQHSVRLRPDFAHAHYHLGIALAEKGKHAEAEESFRRALAVKPAFADCCVRLGDTLAAQGKIDQAEGVYRQAFQLQPSGLLCLTLASTLFRQNRVEEALATFQKAAELSPDSAEVQTAWGSALIGLGQGDEATAHLHEALRLQPGHAAAYGLLGEMSKERCYSFSATEIDSMRRSLADPKTTPNDRVVLLFALAYFLDGHGDHEEAFDHFRRANELQHQLNLENGVAFDATAHHLRVNDLMAGFSSKYFQGVAGMGNNSEIPVFIVGMPRSGTTLIDRIVSAHPQAASAGELIDLEKIVGDLPRLLDHPRTLELLSHLDCATVQDQAERYLRRLQQLGKGAARVTDKMPQNYFYLGFIATLFPYAHVVHCRRDPLDTCLSCYTHNFADFSTSLESLGLYYCEYTRLMSHWEAVLPLRIHVIQYEDLVANPETHIRALIAYCGLPWSDRCLSFYESRGPVHTVSRMQVRRPVYTNSMGRWQKYAAHLGPLRKALES